MLLFARTVPSGWEEAALLVASVPRALGVILLPQLLPALGLIALLVFALAFADYEVASLLQVPTYPVEVFLLYAGVFAPGEAARACLPLLGVALVTAAPLGWLLSRGLIRRWPARVFGEWPVTRSQRRVFVAVALALFAGCVLWPAVGLLGPLGSTPEGFRALRAGAPALANSMLTTMIAVLFAFALGVLASGAVVRARPAGRSLLVATLLLPACLPGPAFAIAWVELLTLLPASFQDTSSVWPPLNPALCLAARWAGLAALLIAAARLALPQDLLDAARLQEGSPLRRAWHVELPLVAPVLVSAAALVAALCHGAVGTLVLTVPAGFEVAPLRIDNLLHYGAREDATALAVAAATLGAGIPLAMALAARGLWRRTS